MKEQYSVAHQLISLVAVTQHSSVGFHRFVPQSFTQGFASPLNLKKKKKKSSRQCPGNFKGSQSGFALG